MIINHFFLYIYIYIYSFNNNNNNNNIFNNYIFRINKINIISFHKIIPFNFIIKFKI